MNKRAQILIPVSAIISVIIIISSFYFATINIKTIEKEEILIKEINISYFCLQSASYGTQKSFKPNINENNTKYLAKVAETIANEYLNDSFIKAEKITKNKEAAKVFIENNDKRGKNSFFSVYCLYNNQILLNITFTIITNETFIVNESENVYYKVEILISTYFRKNFFDEYHIETYYNGYKVDSLVLTSGNKLIVITESKYSNKLLIKIFNNFGIVFWLLS